MNSNFRRITTCVIVLSIFFLAVGVNSVLSAPPAPMVNAGQAFEGNDPEVIIRAGPSSPEPLRNLAVPQAFLRTAPTATIHVTYLPSQAAWPAAAVAAFEFATSVWASNLSSGVPIEIHATYTNMGDPTILGGAGPEDLLRDFVGAPVANTWYPVALANKLAGSDLQAGQPDISAEFNSQMNWYFGTDGKPGANQYDFASVVLHEIGHGLGFIGSMDYESRSKVAGWGFYLSSSAPYYPAIYDRFTYNGSNQSLIDTNLFANPSTSLGAQLTSNSVYFQGPQAMDANGGQKVKLYSPYTWSEGSSYSHLGESFNSTADDLMTYSFGAGDVQHSIGPVILGLFEDIGWGISSSPVSTATSSPDPVVTATQIPPFTPVAFGFLPSVGRNYRASQAAATATQAPTNPNPVTLNGKVTFQGAPAANLPLTLRSYDTLTGNFADLGTTTTDTNGAYVFPNMPAIPSGVEYFVSFTNPSQTSNGMAYQWFSKSITQVVAGTASFGTFDVADIALNTPAKGSMLTLPAMFSWTARMVSSNEQYQFELFGIDQYQNITPQYFGTVGSATSWTLNTLPNGFSPFKTYYWDVLGGTPGGDYGVSYAYRSLFFVSGGARIESEPSDGILPERDYRQLYLHARSLR